MGTCLVDFSSKSVPEVVFELFVFQNSRRDVDIPDIQQINWPKCHQHSWENHCDRFNDMFHKNWVATLWLWLEFVVRIYLLAA